MSQSRLQGLQSKLLAEELYKPQSTTQASNNAVKPIWIYSDLSTNKTNIEYPELKSPSYSK